MNHHALNDFRSGNVALMDELLTDNVAALAAVGAISPENVAQDGMRVRVRADAGAASFRRQASLKEHLSQAREWVQTIKTPVRSDPGQAKRRAQPARLRAAQEREQRIRAALEQLPEVAATKKRNGAKAEDARASTTDADARVMKMGDGGFRPAFNAQFATDCEVQSIEQSGPTRSEMRGNFGLVPMRVRFWSAVRPGLPARSWPTRVALPSKHRT